MNIKSCPSCKVIVNFDDYNTMDNEELLNRASHEKNLSVLTLSDWDLWNSQIRLGERVRNYGDTLNYAFCPCCRRLKDFVEV